MNYAKGSVLVSRSRCIYRNLALEDWLYRRVRCTADDHWFLLMWRNKSSVVIGRHQNPWLECPVERLAANGCDLARRNSGGGTVYHDLGNLNCSFFTPRKKYDLEFNLDLIVTSLAKHWNLNIVKSARHDLLWNGFKISGSASRLGNENSYHHCTLLLDVNHSRLIDNLTKRTPIGVESKATSSVRSSVENLKKVCPGMDPDDVMDQLGREYGLVFSNNNDPIQFDPDDVMFPGLDSIEAGLRSWEWVFGKTPRFVVNDDVIKIMVNRGRVEAAEGQSSAILNLIGVPFTVQDVGRALAESDPMTSQRVLNLVRNVCN